jgi:ribonuclease P protein subunit RPR2
VRPPAAPLRILVVDDDDALRLLLRTTFERADMVVDEAESAADARAAIRRRRPSAIVLDVSLPGTDGITFLGELRAAAETRELGVILLTGNALDPAAARAAGADLLLRKPFSPLELLAAVERVTGVSGGPARLATTSERPRDQLLLYARDLRSMLEQERRQRRELERTYRDTLGALASALESKDIGTGAHSLRVLRYATELARATAPQLLDDPSVEYGFLLHDVGKIGIPDRILGKPAALTPAEQRIMRTHAMLGAEILSRVALLHGEGLNVVRNHHERWDGTGYPDRLAREAIPLGARIFAVADALDAMTSDRPYRRAGSWEAALGEIDSQCGRQFDPRVVEAFRDREPTLRRIYVELAAA